MNQKSESLSDQSRSDTRAIRNGRVHRVNVNFSEEAYAILETLARDQGKTMSEVLRDAIALEKWFQDVIGHGGRVLVEQDGRTKEILPR